MAFSIEIDSIPKVKEAVGPYVRTPEDVFACLKDIGELAQEVFTVITLNIKNKMIDKHVVTVGVLDASLVSPSVVFKRAILDNAAQIIIAHNHPSGDATPSAEDVHVTKQLVEAGKVMDIPVLDHIIIGRSNSFSLRENGLVTF